MLQLSHSEIQLKSPNWLFGQRKYEETAPTCKATSQEVANGESQVETKLNEFIDLGLLSSMGDSDEEDIFKRYFLRIILTS